MASLWNVDFVNDTSFQLILSGIERVNHCFFIADITCTFVITKKSDTDTSVNAVRSNIYIFRKVAVVFAVFIIASIATVTIVQVGIDLRTLKEILVIVSKFLFSLVTSFFATTLIIIFALLIEVASVFSIFGVGVPLIKIDAVVAVYAVSFKFFIDIILLSLQEIFHGHDVFTVCRLASIPTVVVTGISRTQAIGNELGGRDGTLIFISIFHGPV
mmetsp:Transcript_25650/g.39262  ORF Transcript_25650/g.39262 Transcript_25650/m.39262 type:complete len:215 (-) Transcript_25650:882-1526(-)